MINTLRPRQNGRYFADDIFKCIFLIENAWISLKISLTFVPKVRIDNIPALIQIMSWRRPGDKLLSEPMMVSLLTHICVTRPQWVKRGQNIVLLQMVPDMFANYVLQDLAWDTCQGNRSIILRLATAALLEDRRHVCFIPHIGDPGGSL